MAFGISPIELNIGKVNRANPFSPVAPIKRGGAQPANPFSDGSSYAGIGIKDGAIQTSNGQAGKPVSEMRQLGIA